MSANNAAVWIEDRRAHVFHVDAIGFDGWTVETDAPGSFSEVMSTLAEVPEVLVVGPATARVPFVDYLRVHAPRLRVTTIEMVELPSAKELAACLQSYFSNCESSPRR